MTLRERFAGRRGRWLTLVIVAIAIYGIAGGCQAQRLPPPLTPAERALVQQPDLPYTVAVIPWDSTQQRGRDALAYALPTALLLEHSNAFASVRLDSTRAGSERLTAQSTGEYCNTAITPIFTVITLDIFPTVFTDTDCIGITFRARQNPADSVTVRFRHQGRAIMGWVAVPIGFLPGWTHGAAQTHQRYRDHVRVAVLSKGAEIARLMAADSVSQSTGNNR